MTRVLGKQVVDDFENSTPSGTVNGVNTVFTLPSTPEENDSVLVFLNGLKQKQTTDYSVSGTTLTFVVAPALGQSVEVYYLKK